MGGCFNNVRAKVAAQGGRMVYGWSIWQHANLFIEAEHHAVYEPPDGTAWVDITPQDIQTDRVLFLPDDTAVYDFETRKRTTNIRLPIVDDPRAQRVCDLFTEADDLFNSYPVTADHETTVPVSVAVRINTLRMEASQLAQQLDQKVWKNVGRNDPCPCGSGRKYKKCHGA